MEKLRTLHKHILDRKTEDYMKKSISGGGDLSKEILKNIDFSKGTFFTLLPKEADLNRLYEFPYGGIMPANPTEKIFIESLNREFEGEWVNSIDKELANYLLDQLKKSESTCLFEDIIQLKSDPHIELFHRCGLSLDNKIFYLIQKENIDHQLISDCIHEASSPGYFLCILTETNLNDIVNQELNREKIAQACENTQMIIVGAYDGEGYIFWEKDKN